MTRFPSLPLNRVVVDGSVVMLIGESAAGESAIYLDTSHLACVASRLLKAGVIRLDAPLDGVPHAHAPVYYGGTK